MSAYSFSRRLSSVEKKIGLGLKHDPSVIHLDSLIDVIRFAQLARDVSPQVQKTIVMSGFFKKHVAPFAMNAFEVGHEGK